MPFNSLSFLFLFEFVEAGFEQFHGCDPVFKL